MSVAMGMAAVESATSCCARPRGARAALSRSRPAASAGLGVREPRAQRPAACAAHALAAGLVGPPPRSRGLRASHTASARIDRRPRGRVGGAGGRAQARRARTCASVGVGAAAGAAAIAGAVAGVVEVLVGHPFDSVKTQQQTAGKGDPTTFIGMAVHMMRTRGIGAFYAGVMAPAIQKGIGISFMFGAMEALRTLTGAHPWDTPIRWMVCCAMVGFFESFVYCPLDLIKARLQVGREKSILECARAITKTNGTFGVYLGWRLHALKEMVGNIGLFTGFEAGNALFLSLGLPTPVATCLGGSVSGVLYYFLPHPFDTLKSIVQTAERSDHVGPIKAFRQLTAEGGILRLYAGVGAAMLRAVFGMAAMFMTFEGFKVFL